MARLLQNKDEYAQKDFLCEIRKGQGERDLMNGRALSHASGIPYQTLMRRLAHPEDFTLGELRQLIGAIPLRPWAVLTFIGFKSKDIRRDIPETVN